MKAMATDSLVAAFLAKGGEVKKCAAGEFKPNSELGKTGAERFFEKVGRWQKDEVKKEHREKTRREVEQGITVVTDHMGREFYKNAEGEWL